MPQGPRAEERSNLRRQCAWKSATLSYLPVPGVPVGVVPGVAVGVTMGMGEGDGDGEGVLRRLLGMPGSAARTPSGLATAEPAPPCLGVGRASFAEVGASCANAQAHRTRLTLNGPSNLFISTVSSPSPETFVGMFPERPIRG